MKKCLYCLGPIPSGNHGNSGACCEKHKKLRKRAREKANYIKQTTIAKPILKLQDLLIEFADRFGYETPIELSIVGSYKIDWALCTGTFQKEGHTGKVVGKVGYIFLKPNHIKIYKL
jgi:hypothetical protein